MIADKINKWKEELGMLEGMERLSYLVGAARLKRR